MSIELVRIDQSDRPVLRNLSELYLYDFSEYTNDDVSAHGLYDWGIDRFFTEPERQPYFVLESGKYAGFALIRADLAWIAGKGTHDMMEFFVMRKYRRQGIGSDVAIRCFDLLPGRWEVRVMVENIPAQRFWKKVISHYTSGQYEEQFLNIPEGPNVHDWNGPAFYFNSPEQQ